MNVDQDTMNAILTELRQWAQAQLTGGQSTLDTPGAAQSLQGLDTMLSQGHELPDDWKSR